MKKSFWLKGAAVLAVGLALVGAARAESDSGRERRGDRGDRGRNEDNTEMREKFQNRMVEMISDRLDLDTATTAKVKALFDQQAQDRTKLNEDMKTSVRKLKDLVDNKASEAELSAQIDKIEALKQQQRSLESTTLASLRSILGTEKTAKLVIMQSMMMNRMREHVREMSAEGSRRGRGIWRHDGDNTDRHPNTGNWGYN